MRRSSRTRCGAHVSHCATAPSPLVALRASMPTESSSLSRQWRTSHRSSTTSTRYLGWPGDSPTARSVARWRAAPPARASGASTSDRRTSKRSVVPRPTWLSTRMSPPIIRTMRRLMCRPRPVPSRDCRPVAVCANASKSSASSALAMPRPVSVTSNDTRTHPAAPSCAPVARRAEARSVTDPRGVNFSALPSRLISTCRSFPSSPWTCRGTSCSCSTVSVRPRFWASTANISESPESVSWRSKSVSTSVMRPASILAISRMSLTRPSRCSPLLQMTARFSRCRTASEGSRSTSCAKPRIELSGVLELVAHVGEERALRPARGHGLLPRPARLLLGPPRLGEPPRPAAAKRRGSPRAPAPSARARARGRGAAGGAPRGRPEGGSQRPRRRRSRRPACDVPPPALRTAGRTGAPIPSEGNDQVTGVRGSPCGPDRPRRAAFWRRSGALVRRTTEPSNHGW